MSHTDGGPRQVLGLNEIAEMPQRRRVRLINSISGFKPANLVGTADAHGNAACCIVSSVVHLGSNPALMGVVFRPPGADAHNYRNLSSAGCFTLNHVTADMYTSAHQTSARYPENVSEFEAVGLTPHWHGPAEDQFQAPAVAESPVRMGLTVSEDLALPNGCHFIIGAVQWVDYRSNGQAEDGFLDLAALDTVCIGGLDAYYTASRLGRLSYAKPESMPEVRTDFMKGWD